MLTLAELQTLESISKLALGTLADTESKRAVLNILNRLMIEQDDMVKDQEERARFAASNPDSVL